MTQGSVIRIPFDPAPVAYWTLDDDDLADGVYAEPQNNLVATLRGSPTTGLNAPVGQGIATDGVDDFASIPDDAVLDFEATSPFSLAAWVRGEANNDTYFGKRDAGGAAAGWAMGVGTINDGPFLLVADGTNLSIAEGGGTITDGAWHHIVATWDGANLGTSSMTFYFDGVAVLANSISSFALGDIRNNVPAAIGATGGDGVSSRGYGALLGIDEVAAWDVELTAAQVAQLYQYGHAGRVLA